MLAKRGVKLVAGERWFGGFLTTLPAKPVDLQFAFRKHEPAYGAQAA
jgi:hypothetical protein